MDGRSINIYGQNKQGGFVVIKGTKMIVITKDKIIKLSIFIFLVTFLCLISLITSNNISMTAFSEYENIIESQIVPGQKEEEKPKEKKSRAEKILKRFFVLSDKKKEPEKKEEPAEQVTQGPVLRSESLTIDKGIQVSNRTEYSVNPQDFLNKPLAFSFDNSNPSVLIMHTHTTESFSEEAYIKGAPDRNLDETKNITAVGNAMRQVFDKNGIKAVHDKTVHDYPSYNSAYQSAAATINKNLNSYGGICVVLDVHRDGITREDGTKVKLVTDINGEKTAQIMLVVGTDTNLPHDKWQENFKFASKIQAKGVEMYPSLMRPIDLRKERFNEQLTLGSIIIEVGSNGNTMEEAIRGGERIAEIISAVLKEG